MKEEKKANKTIKNTSKKSEMNAKNEVKKTAPKTNKKEMAQKTTTKKVVAKTAPKKKEASEKKELTNKTTTKKTSNKIVVPKEKREPEKKVSSKRNETSKKNATKKVVSTKKITETEQKAKVKTTNKKTKEPKKVEEIKVIGKETIESEVVPKEIETKEIKTSIKSEAPNEIKEEKVIKEELTLTNYLTVVAIVLSTILVGVLIARTFSNYENADYTKSYLVENNIVNQISCNDINNAVKGSQSFIYVTTLQSEEEYNLEKELASIIKSYNIKEDFYVYIEDESCGSISKPESIAGTNLKLENGINNLPVILYYRNGDLIDTVKRLDKNMINDGDFVHLLDKYEIK